MAEKQENVLRIDGARISFPEIFTPRMKDDGSKGSYGASFIIPKGHAGVKLIAAEITRVAKEKWPKEHENILEVLKAAGKVCLRDGAVKAHLEGYKGNVFFTANNKAPIGVFNRDGKMITEGCENTPYAGCYVNVTMEIWAQDHPQHGKRINGSLRGVQFADDGDSFGGGSRATKDEFGAPTEGAGAEMPIGAGAEEEDYTL